MEIVLNVKNEKYLSPIDKNSIEGEVRNILEKAFNDNDILNALLLDIVNAFTTDESNDKELKAESLLDNIWSNSNMNLLMKQYAAKLILDKLISNKAVSFESMFFITNYLSNYFLLFDDKEINKDMLISCKDIYCCLYKIMNNIIMVEKSIDYGNKNEVILNWINSIEDKDILDINNLYYIVNDFYCISNRSWRIADVILVINKLDRYLPIKINNFEYKRYFTLNSEVNIVSLGKEKLMVKPSDAFVILLFNISIAKYKYEKNYEGMPIEVLIEGAKNNLPEAQFYLANRYYFGQDVEKDSVKAEYWYNKSMISGNIKAKNILGNAAYKLAKNFKSGKDVNRNINQAIKWYRYSINLGNKDAKYDLGKMYLYGNGIEKDFDKGFKLINESANEGNEDATLLLANIYYNGIDVEKNEKEAFKRYTQIILYGVKNYEEAFLKIREIK